MFKIVRWNLLFFTVAFALLFPVYEARAWPSAVHENLTRITVDRYRFPQSEAIVSSVFEQHSVLLEEGVHEPDDGRDNLFLEFSHRYDAGKRAGWAFCAAVKSTVSDSAAAARHLGHAFHYLQDLGDPTKEFTKRNGRPLRNLAKDLVQQVYRYPQSMRVRAIWHYVEYESRNVDRMSFSTLRHYLSSSRATLSQGLRQYPASAEDLLLRSLAMNLVAQRRAIALFSAASYEPQNCDPGPYLREPRRGDRNQYYLVRISGAGYVTNYAGSWYYTGHEDRVLVVPPGETFSLAKHNLEMQLRGNPCEQGIAAAYGPVSGMPQFWMHGPTVSKLAGPELLEREIRRYRIEQSWNKAHSTGPPIGVLQQRFGCRHQRR